MENELCKDHDCAVKLINDEVTAYLNGKEIGKLRPISFSICRDGSIGGRYEEDATK